MAQLCLLVAGIGILSWRILYTWSFTVDDSYITLRYSQNLVSHSTLTFNPGQAPVEGYTTFLWMLYLTLPHLLGLDAVLFAKLSGVVCALLTLVVVYRLGCEAETTQQRSTTEGAAALAVFFLAVIPASAVHAVSGMETSLSALLLSVLSLSAILWLRGARKRNAYLLALSGLLLGLARPDGNVAVVAAISTAWVLSDRVHRARLQLAVLLGYVLPGSIYFMSRAFYFDSLLPLPFQVKIAHAHLFSGVGQVARYVLYFCLPMTVPLLVGLYRSGRELWPMIGAGLALGIFFTLPAHIMGYDSRYLYPVTPIVAVLVGLGSMRLWEFTSNRWNTRPIRAGTGVLVVFLIGTLMVNYMAAESISDKLAYSAGMHTAHLPLAAKLRALTPTTDSPVVAAGDVGAIGYISRWEVLDLYGLTDENLAWHPGDVGYVLGRHPDVVVLASDSGADFRGRSTFEDRLFINHLDKGYSVLKKLEFGPRYVLWVLGQSQTAISDSLESNW